MKVDVFDKENNKLETIDLSEKVFNIKWNPDLVNQVLLAQMSNRHEAWAHTKGRGDVRGGGKKPWRQKGTGRARHGSTRSPIWKGGGVTFGPTKERNFIKKINKKMKRLAIFSALSQKMKDNEIKIIDNFNIDLKKTNEWKKELKNIIDLRTKTLLISSSVNNIHKPIANMKRVGSISSKSLNIYDLLNFKNIVLEKKAVEEIEKHYNK
ncbi:50S ribosomal protein L4 [Candidatus Wolfebacteria bacterium]|nr:50S ribosomal protein L4 [Candidatus Wolfebacteria bacterium]